ncbi:MAG: hypothetical protein NTU88_13665, partial [Armatimonadetes bacterium]|nr:hypothetical protein [Armatimonadota bacterium]
ALFPLQMAGDYCKFITYAIEAPMIPQERFFARNVICVAQYAIYMVVFYVMLPKFGLVGVVAANLALWSFALISMYLYLNRVNGYKFDRSNVRLLVTSAAGLLAIIATLQMHGLWWRLAGWGVMGLWMAMAPTSDDRAKLMEVIRARLSRSSETTRASEVIEADPSSPTGGIGSGPE